jgi:hypothetical protein
MRKRVVASLLVLVVVASSVAGYFVGASNQRTVTTTSTTISFSTITSVTTSSETITLGSTTGQLGPWINTTSYPAPRGPASCAIAGGYVYCVGGNGNDTYFATISSNGVGQWTRSTDYPIPIQDENCIESSNYIYCVGGVSIGPNSQSTDPYRRTPDVFYAPLSKSGIGPWAKTTPFPYIAASPRCMAYSSLIYCIEAGFDGTGYMNSAEAFFAPLSANGVGSWVQTSSPPSMTAGCSAIGSDAYCFGGASCPPTGPDSDCYSPSYFAPLSPSGIGNWSRTMDLPTAGYALYVTAGSYIYYLSIPIFFAQGSTRGIGSWGTTTNFPGSANPAACASSGVYIYCVGGGTNDVYYAQVGEPNPNSFMLQNPPPFPRADYLGPACHAWVTVNGTFAGAPCLSRDIDDAVIFDCAVSAASPTGCRTTVVSPTNTENNFNVTIWYPQYNASLPDTNCAFKPSLGYKTPFYAWCISVGQNTFIIVQQIAMRPSQT